MPCALAHRDGWILLDLINYVQERGEHTAMIKRHNIYTQKYIIHSHAFHSTFSYAMYICAVKPEPLHKYALCSARKPDQHVIETTCTAITYILYLSHTCINSLYTFEYNFKLTGEKSTHIVSVRIICFR